MAQPILFQRETHSGTEQGATLRPEGNSTVFSRLPHHDFLTFIAIAQRIPRFRLFDFIPAFEQVGSRRGLSGVVHSVSLPFNQHIIFKRFHVTRSFTEEMAYKALICELLVQEHPILKKERNIQKLLGVAWDVQTFQGTLIRVMPVLVSKKADHGTLIDFMNSRVSFAQRVQFCRDIGRAIEAMHELNIVHGDIKPSNILIFEENNGLVAKVIDFGCSCFGSRDDDLVLLSRTAQWAAPEVGNLHMSIKAAKLADIYSYGMVCAWIFFGQEKSVADFAGLPSNFDQAAEHLMQIGETELEQSQGTYMRLSTGVRHMKNFFESSFQAAHEKRAQNVKYLLDQLECLVTVWNTRQDSSIGNHRSSLDVLSTLPDTFGLPRIKYFIRVSIRQLLVLLILGRNNKAFIPGQPQLVCGDQVPLYPLFGIALWVVGVLFFMEESIKWIVAASVHRWVAYVDLGLLLMLCMVAGCFFCFGEKWGRFWYLVQRIRRPISIYGQIQHAIPDLPDIYSLLNETHYLVREHLVTELERRTQSGCNECRSDAALQLALCYHIALGTSRDIDASDSWLKFAKKKERHLRRLCKEVDGSIFLPPRSELLVLGGREFHFSASKMLASNVDTYFESRLPAITRRLSREIDGKRASKVGLHSISSLHDELGRIYRTHGDLESAENHFKAATKAEEIFEGYRYSAIILADVLDEQGKESEALDELLGDTKLMVNPNGRCVADVDMKLLPVVFENRRFYEREKLANLLIRQEKSDTALKLDPISDLDDVVLHRGKDDNYTTGVLENILSLAQLLSRQMRKDEAADLLRRRLKAHVEMFGESHLRTMKATSDLIFMLSDMGADHVDEAICLQPPSLDLYEGESWRYFQPNMEVLLFKTAFAFALSKQRRFDEAIAEMNLVIQFKKRNWTGGEHVTQGCMRDLADSLYVQGEGEYRVPGAMELEMLVISKRTQSLKVKEQIISILCTLPRLRRLGEVLEMLRILEEALRDRYSDGKDRVKVQGYIVFILANLSLCSENPFQVEEALGLSTAVKEEVIEKSGWDDMDRVYVMRSLASVYWIKSFMACQIHGFGSHDLSWMDQAEQIHRQAVTMATATFGDTHEETVHAAHKEASLLALHEIARDKLRFPRNSTFLDRLWDPHRGKAVSWSRRFEPNHPGPLGKDQRELRHKLRDSYYFDASKEYAHKSLKDGLEKLRTYYRRSNEKPDRHPQIIRNLEAIAQAYWLEGKTFQALATSKHVVRLARMTFAGGDSHPSTVAYRVLLMRPLLEDVAVASSKVETARELLELCVKTFGKQHTHTLSCMNELAWIICERGQKSEATELMQQVLELGLPFLGVNHSIVSQTWTNLLAATNTATFGNVDLRSKVRDFAWGAFSRDFLIAIDEIIRLVVGATILGEDHIFTRSVVDHFVLRLQYDFDMSFEVAVQTLQKFKDMPWSGFRPSVTTQDENGLLEAESSNRGGLPDPKLPAGQQQ